MYLRIFSKFLIGSTLFLGAAAGIALTFIATDIQTITHPKCLYVGSEDSKRHVFIDYKCYDQPQTSSNWQEQLRIIRKYVVYDGLSSCLIFSDAQRQFSESGDESLRSEILKEMRLYSGLLALGAQTAEQASSYKHELGLRPKFWATQFRFWRFIIEGPLSWTIPKNETYFEFWRMIYSGAVLGPADAFMEMCTNFEPFKGACVDGGLSIDIMKSMYNYGPVPGPCSISEIYR